MIPWVVKAEYIAGHRAYITFNDDTSGEINLSDEFDGEIFEPLKDEAYFERFRIEGHTLAWENGADFAPKYLRGLLAEQVGAVC